MQQFFRIDRDRITNRVCNVNEEHRNEESGRRERELRNAIAAACTATNHLVQHLNAD